MFLFKILTLLPLSCMAVAPIVQENPPKVVVVGAGIAGLTTAYRLQQLGVAAEVYEARGRVGGRILSVQVNGQMSELGAQNLADGGEAENLFRLIDGFGLRVQKDHFLNNCVWFTGGKLVPDHTLLPPLDPDSLWEQLTTIRKTSKTMSDVLTTLLGDAPAAFKYLSRRLATYEGGPAEKLSSLYIETLHRMMCGGICAVHPERTFTLASIQGGNSLLPEKLAQALEGHIHLNSPLVSVSKAQGGAYTLLFQHGQRVHADLLVLAIPCSVYGDIHFEDSVIPEERLEGIRSVQYGSNAKILIPFQDAPQQGPVLINDRMLAFFDTGRSLLTCYYTGDSSRFSADTINATLREDQPMLEAGGYSPFPPPVMAQDAPFIRFAGPVGYSWPNDPYVKGSYYYIASGQESLLMTTESVDGETVKTLFAPIGQTLYFAGEHASILHDVPATMESACESGERAARMIAKRLQPAR